MSVYYEKEDIHPVFLSNLFLIEEGATLKEYEHPLPSGRVDFYLEDRNGSRLFVEVEWASLDHRQILGYVASIKNRETGRNYRIMWLIPEDLRSSVPEYVISSLRDDGVEVKTYSRQKIEGLIELRKEARAVIDKILSLLHRPVQVKMIKEYTQFANPMQACYFDGRVVSDGRKVGLKKTSTGWYLDLLKCVLSSQHAHNTPDLVLELLKELMDAPYYYEYRGRGHVNELGFHDFIVNSKFSEMKPIVDLVQEIVKSLDEFHKKFTIAIPELYDNDVVKYDLMVRLTFGLVERSTLGGVLLVDALLRSMIEEFQIKPSEPVTCIRHSTVGDIVSSVKSAEGYENNMAKRMVELCCLKSIFFPSRAIYGPIEVLTPKYILGREGYERIRVQRFIYNKDKSTYKSLVHG